MSSESFLYQPIHLICRFYDYVSLHLDLNGACVLTFFDLFMQYIFSILEPLDTVNRDFVSVHWFDFNYFQRFLTLCNLDSNLPLTTLLDNCILFCFIRSYLFFLLCYYVCFQLIIHLVSRKMLSSLVVEI